MAQKILMTASDIKRTLARIAHEIIEQNRASQDLVLVGIYTRGVPLAHRLAGLIEVFAGIKLPVATLDISRYRDDNPSPKGRNGSRNSDIPESTEGKSIVLVDDVLYTGRSIRAAMDALIDLGRPKLIQLAVLVDRGHREMPIRADYVGKNIPSAHDEKIQVHLMETDNIDEVAIIDIANDKSNGNKPNGGNHLKRSSYGTGR